MSSKEICLFSHSICVANPDVRHILVSWMTNSWTISSIFEPKFVQLKMDINRNLYDAVFGVPVRTNLLDSTFFVKCRKCSTEEELETFQYSIFYFLYQTCKFIDITNAFLW